ncbi:MAG: hypothetical protein V4549_18910 [Bacteroidota bacterium]
MKKAIIISSMAILSACSAKLALPTQTDVNNVLTKYPDYTWNELVAGKWIYENNCKSCHGLKEPSSRSEVKWNETVPRMVKKVNKKLGVEKIDSKKQELLLRYLITMSKVPKAK